MSFGPFTWFSRTLVWKQLCAKRRIKCFTFWSTKLLPLYQCSNFKLKYFTSFYNMEQKNKLPWLDCCLISSSRKLPTKHFFEQKAMTVWATANEVAWQFEWQVTWNDKNTGSDSFIPLSEVMAFYFFLCRRRITLTLVANSPTACHVWQEKGLLLE